MQPLKLKISGRYWDTQIYQGRLYLFRRDGTILTLDWDRLIEDLPFQGPLKPALRCAFQRSDYLYKMAGTGILHDKEFRSIMIKRFSILEQESINVEDINRFCLGEQDNRFPFPHADSTIYKRRVYVSSRSGIFSATCGNRTVHPISTRIDKLWDGPVLSLSASYSSLALATGEYGLWEYTLDNGTSPEINPFLLSHRHCSDCQWAFHSVYGSSCQGPGVFAYYRKETGENRLHDGPSRKYVRRLDHLIPEQNIFKGFGEPQGSYSWAAQDKICQLSNGAIRVVKYQPWDRENSIRPLGFLSLARQGEPIVSARTALFGIIVELESSLVTVLSNEETCSVASEPVSWRVFPRSRYYENHLHVVHDNYVEINSFNHDYLIDQDTKMSGISRTSSSRGNLFDSPGSIWN